MLPGITRATVLQLCQDVGFELIEQVIPREWLYIADELFFSGTAAEITPIRSVDRIQIGSGERGSDDRAPAAGIHGGHYLPKGRPSRLADLCQNAELRHSLSYLTPPNHLRRQWEGVHEQQGCFPALRLGIRRSDVGLVVTECLQAYQRWFWRRCPFTPEI